MKEQGQRVKRSFRLIEKCSRSNFDEFLSNQMTDNEPNNLHIYKQKKEKNIATAQCACSRTKVIIQKSRGGVSLEEQDTIENVS